MNRHYIEPIGWLWVCLLFIVALAVIVAPLGLDSRQPDLQQAFDPKALKSTSKRSSSKQAPKIFSKPRQSAAAPLRLPRGGRKAVMRRSVKI